MVQRPSPAARLQSSEASASSSPVGVTPSDSSEEDGPRRGWAERCEAGEEKVGCESDDDDEEEEDYDYDLPAGPLLRSGRERREDVYELGGRSRMQEGARRGHRLDGRWDDGAREDGGESADGLEKGGEDGDLEGAMAYTAEEERGVVRKFDRRLVLFVALLYLLSFLDRSNIGNAFVAGMNEDLLRATDPMSLVAKSGRRGSGGGSEYYEWALTSFYLAYIAFEWLSLLWTVVPPHVFVSAIVLSWGVVASLQAVAPSYPWLIALRFLLGIGEAGFTGIPIYLSFFFRRDELALRTAVFISAAPLATTFASSLAWLILKLGENGPIAPWRLLFLLEGFPAVIVATIAWRVVPDSPDRASYLTKRERLIARQRLVRPAQGEPLPLRAASDEDLHHGAKSSTAPRQTLLSRCATSARAVLLDPAAWATAAIFFLTNMAFASLPVFLPSILTQMGHDPVSAQALAAPPYLVSFLVVLAAAATSDALRSRGLLIAAAALCSSLGYAFLALSRRLGGGDATRLDMARYLAVYPAAAGFFVVVVLTISWNVNNARPGGEDGGRGGKSTSHHHKGGAYALMQAVGQCGPLVGVRLYPESDGPWFERGMGVCAVAMLGVASLALGLRAWLARANRRMDEKAAAARGEEGVRLVAWTGTSEDLVRGGDDGFRYML